MSDPKRGLTCISWHRQLLCRVHYSAPLCFVQLVIWSIMEFHEQRRNVRHPNGSQDQTMDRISSPRSLVERSIWCFCSSRVMFHQLIVVSETNANKIYYWHLLTIYFHQLWFPNGEQRFSVDEIFEVKEVHLAGNFSMMRLLTWGQKGRWRWMLCIAYVSCSRKAYQWRNNSGVFFGSTFYLVRS